MTESTPGLAPEFEAMIEVAARAAADQITHNPGVPLEWVDTAGAAKYLSLAPGTVEKLRKSGVIKCAHPTYKVVRFHVKEHLDAYLRASVAS